MERFSTQVFLNRKTARTVNPNALLIYPNSFGQLFDTLGLSFSPQPDYHFFAPNSPQLVLATGLNNVDPLIWDSEWSQLNLWLDNTLSDHDVLQNQKLQAFIIEVLPYYLNSLPSGEEPSGRLKHNSLRQDAILHFFRKPTGRRSFQQVKELDEYIKNRGWLRK